MARVVTSMNAREVHALHELVTAVRTGKDWRGIARSADFVRAAARLATLARRARTYSDRERAEREARGDALRMERAEAESIALAAVASGAKTNAQIVAATAGRIRLHQARYATARLRKRGLIEHGGINSKAPGWRLAARSSAA